ncbi:Uncharacterised protein [Bordetella pertussis]|nr:Uncharacterised protein [Bordetella pertussis]
MLDVLGLGPGLPDQGGRHIDGAFEDEVQLGVGLCGMLSGHRFCSFRSCRYRSSWSRRRSQIARCRVIQCSAMPSGCGARV